MIRIMKFPVPSTAAGHAVAHVSLCYSFIIVHKEKVEIIYKIIYKIIYNWSDTALQWN